MVDNWKSMWGYGTPEEQSGYAPQVGLGDNWQKMYEYGPHAKRSAFDLMSYYGPPTAAQPIEQDRMEQGSTTIPQVAQGLLGWLRGGSFKMGDDGTTKLGFDIKSPTEVVQQQAQQQAVKQQAAATGMPKVNPNEQWGSMLQPPIPQQQVTAPPPETPETVPRGQWSRTITGERPDVLSRYKQAVDFAYPSRGELLADAAAQDKRSRFERIVQSIFTQDPFYTDKVHQNIAAYELNRRHGLAEAQLKVLDKEYDMYTQNLQQKGKLLQDALNNNPNLRNNRDYLVDLGRAYNMTEEESGKWVDSMYDKKTGKYTFIQDPVERTKQAVENGAKALMEIYPDLIKDYTTAKMLAQDPEATKKYLSDAEYSITHNLNQARLQGKQEKVAQYGRLLWRVRDYKNDGGLTFLYFGNKLLDDWSQEVDANPNFSSETRQSVKEFIGRERLYAADKYLTGGLVAASQKKEGKEEEAEIDKDLKRRKDIADLQNKILDTAKKKREIPTPSEEISHEIWRETKGDSALAKDTLVMKQKEIASATEKIKTGKAKEMSEAEVKTWKAYKDNLVHRYVGDKIPNITDDEAAKLDFFIHRLHTMGMPVDNARLIMLMKQYRQEKGLRK